MKITRVELKNVTQHRDVNIDIHDNVVGIIGQNGSGKSNFASSISIAVTGEFGKKKKDLITYGEKTGSIEVSGIIKYVPFVINRNLHNNEASLEYGSDTINGSDAVTDKMLELLGCDKSFLPNMVFVTQQDILGLLFGRAAERNKMLQKFFGLEKAAKIEQLIGRWKSNIPYPAIIDESQARAAIESVSKMKKNLEAELGERRDKISSLREFLDSANEDKILSNKKRALRKESIEAKIEEKIAYKESLSNSLKSLTIPKVTNLDIENIKERLASAVKESGGIKEMIKILDAASCSHDKSGDCSICGNKLTEDIVESMGRRLEESRKASSKIDRTIFAISKELEDASSELSSYETKRDQYTANIDSANTAIEVLKKELEDNQWPKHSSEAYEGGLMNIRDARTEMSNAEEQASIIISSIGGLVDQIAQHEKDLESAKTVGLKYSGTKIHESRISRVRDVFRHDGISGLYVNSKMNQMCSSINQYLQSFGAQYRVSVDKDNDFVCDFGSKKVPASDLSCGQKVTLSLAFRFAACEIFSTGVDLIVLDEPTTWLDRNTIANFKEIIESISELSDSQNLQILTVTHERSLIPYFRQTIEF